MKKLRLVVGVALLLSLVLVGTPARAGTQDFSISLFSADYYLSRDPGGVAELKVTEKIVARFPDFDQNHGILRALPQKYQDHTLELNVESVKNGTDNAWKYETYTENDNLVLKIGDADKYVKGEQTYLITYTVRGVTMNTDAGQSFYWDVNGDQWQQQFQKVEARLHVPADIASKLEAPSRCYTGAFGSQTSNCDIYFSYDQGKGRTISVATKPQAQLKAGETLSLEFGFAKDTFASYSPSAKEITRLALIGAGIVGLPLITLAVLVRNYLRHGRDPKGKEVVVPQYLPPKGVSVLGAQVVLTEAFVSKAASATIVDLAVRHYLKIYETQQKGVFKNADYTIELIKSPANLLPEEKGVVDMLFGAAAVTGAEVKLSSLKTTLATKAEKLGKDAEKRMVAEGYFGKSPSSARAPYYIVGFVLALAGFLLLGLGPWTIGLIISGVMILIAAFAMPARTAKGVELRTYLHGLRDYIKLAEVERLKVLQSPRGDLTEKIDVSDNKQLIKLYERLLPYAILFGLEKDWAKVMAPLYDQQPDWYSGHAAFNAAWFAGSLSSFNASAGTAFSPPSSSGSGGGAGGGGGGGGGGGW